MGFEFFQLGTLFHLNRIIVLFEKQCMLLRKILKKCRNKILKVTVFFLQIMSITAYYIFFWPFFFFFMYQ